MGEAETPDGSAMTDGVADAALGTIESFLDERAGALIAAAAVAFLFKLGHDFIREKQRQAASLRIVDVYIRLAVKDWEHPDIRPERGGDRSILRLAAHIETIGDSRAEGGKEAFTPFVPYTPQDDLSVAEIRDFLGFLDRQSIECAVDFIQTEAMAHALAADFRSEFVRQQFTQDRKIALLRLYNEQIVEAYDNAEKALRALAPFLKCPRLFWCAPFGYRVWRFCSGSGKRKPTPADRMVRSEAAEAQVIAGVGSKAEASVPAERLGSENGLGAGSAHGCDRSFTPNVALPSAAVKSGTGHLPRAGSGPLLAIKRLQRSFPAEGDDDARHVGPQKRFASPGPRPTSPRLSQAQLAKRDHRN